MIGILEFKSRKKRNMIEINCLIDHGKYLNIIFTETSNHVHKLSFDY